MDELFNTRHNIDTIQKIFSRDTLASNIDLNLSQNLENLEDPLLIQHISDSRKLLEKNLNISQELKDLAVNIIKTQENEINILKKLE